MSTYLDLVNNVLTRINEVNLDSSNFASARGLHQAAKLGVLNAVMQINAQRWEWPFNYATDSETLVAGTNLYSFPADYKVADWESFYIVAGTYGDRTIETTRLWPIQRQEWYKWYREGDLDNAVDGKEVPRKVFWDSSQKFGVTPVPDEAYVVNYNYWKNTTELSAYDDTVTVPTNFNWVVEQGALEDMYNFLDNDQRALLGKTSFQDGINRMALMLVPQTIGDMRDTRVNFGNRPFFAYGKSSNPML